MKLYILALKQINSRRLSPSVSSLDFPGDLVGGFQVILWVVRSIKEVLILLHVLVDILRLDMIAETISIREQQLSLRKL